MSTSFKLALRVTVGLLIGCPAVTASAGPMDQSVFEGFEGISPNTTPGVPFSIGAVPEEATFSGNAFAGVVGQGVLYHTGIRSWMVLENSIGRVDFNANAAVVDFFARPHPTADGNTVITAYDDSDTQIGSTFTLTPGSDWTEILFSGNIDHLLVDNQATNIMNGIDDFGFTAVPEPSSIAICAIATVVSMGFRRRSKIQYLLPSTKRL